MDIRNNTVVISDSIKMNSRYLEPCYLKEPFYVEEPGLDICPMFICILFSVITNYGYLKVNFL